MAKKGKVKIYWGRIFIALALLVAVIVLFVYTIKAIAGAFIDDDSKVESSSSVSSETEEKSDTLTVFVDPGHGGEEDCGAPSTDGTRFERDDNLSLALLVREKLEDMGVTVVMSHDDNTFVELENIAGSANKSDADLFVSIHRNSSEDNGQGIQAFVNWNAPKADTLLAENILDAFSSDEITQNRGVSFGYTGYDPSAHVNYYVCEHTAMPSCLLEVGFITDDEDNELYDTYKESYAQSIADGILKTAYQLGLIKDESGEVTTINLDNYSYPGAPDTEEVTYELAGISTTSSSSSSSEKKTTAKASSTEEAD